MSDLSVFRFAKSASSGWTTAAGMYVGHYMAWIAAALLYAVYLKTSEAQAFLTNGEAPPVSPGPLAYNAIGTFGLVTVRRIASNPAAGTNPPKAPIPAAKPVCFQSQESCAPVSMRRTCWLVQRYVIPYPW